MMDYPLTIQAILRRADQLHGEKEVVSMSEPGTSRGGVHRYDYRTMAGRVRRLASTLIKMGIKPGDRIATFGQNSFRHLELYFAVPIIGAVLHPLNIRLFSDQLAFIVDHADDQMVFFDANLEARLQPVLESVTNTDLKLVRMGTRVTVPSPDHGLEGAIDYEYLVAKGDDRVILPDLREESACSLFYTSGTTGDPKGVVYSHRAVFLHTMALGLADGFGIRESDTVLTLVPQFHANAWGLPYACAFYGARQVFPGPTLSPEAIGPLFSSEAITFSAAVPSVWIPLLEYFKTNRTELGNVRMLLSGGAAAPESLIEAYERDLGVKLVHSWGMTELAPVGTLSTLRKEMFGWSLSDQLKVRAKQGVPTPGLELRIIDDEGQEQPWDGESQGELEVRGPWVAAHYLGEYESSCNLDGWFRT